MNLFELLSSDEKDMMEKYIDAYLFSKNDEGNYRTASLEYIMREWAQEKENLFHLFGNRFIISQEVSFVRSEDELAMDLDNKLCGYGKVGHRFIDSYYSDFLNTAFDGRGSDWYNARDLVNTLTLAGNIYEGDTFEITDPNGKSIKISHGCKVLKALGKIATAFKLEGFEEFRICHSQILNQKKLRGNLCLSIHPLDFMTMSDNECDWNSCMSWADYGCYRQGTVEMMNSPLMVVAYLTAEEPMHMPGTDERWSNKKWRELFIVDKNIIANVKGYPYRNEDLSKKVLEWLKELAEVHEFGAYTEKVYEYNAFRRSYIDELHKEVTVEPHTCNMYNDFSDNQFAYFGTQIPNHYSFYYSGASECLSCGSTDCDFDGEGQLVGECCESRFVCEFCGESYNSDEDFVEVDGQWICPYCYENHTVDDSFTGEAHLDSYIRRLYITFDNGKHFINNHYHVFEDFDRHEMAYYTRAIYRIREYWNTAFFVKAEDLTDEGIYALGFDDFDRMKQNLDQDGKRRIRENTRIDAIELPQLSPALK